MNNPTTEEIDQLRRKADDEQARMRRDQIEAGFMPGPMQLVPAAPSPAEIAFDEAFAAAQAQFGPIHRTRTVNVAMRTGGSYVFSYAPLETILAACVPALAAQGISITQKVRIDTSFEEPLHYLVTTLRKAGYSTGNEVLIFKGEPTAQAYGSAVTYARRMGVTLAFCIAPDDDSDGNTDTLKDQPMTKRPEPQRQAERPAQAQTFASVRDKIAANAKKPEPLKKPPVYTEKELADMEGQIIDAVQEMLEACSEGRRIGIEQIWGEIKANEYVAQRVWRTVKERSPDLFATMKAVLKPEGDKTARGPKPQDESGPVDENEAGSRG